MGKRSGRGNDRNARIIRTKRMPTNGIAAR